MSRASRPAPRARDFAALAGLKLALQTAQREAAEQAAREAERRAREQHERELFTRSVGRVAGLRTAALPHLARTPPAPIPRQRLRDEAAVLAESISDGIDAISLLETEAALSFHCADVGADVVRRLRRGQWAIQAELDLHGLRRDAAREHLLGFLREAGALGLRCVRSGHGKGNGSPGREPVLKAKVRHWLQQKSEVMAYTQARACDGGHGALIVLLRPAARREAPSSN